VKLSSASPIMRLMLENGGLKAEIVGKYEQAFGKRIRIEVADGTQQGEPLNKQELIDIID